MARGKTSPHLNPEQGQLLAEHQRSRWVHKSAKAECDVGPWVNPIDQLKKLLWNEQKRTMAISVKLYGIIVVVKRLSIGKKDFGCPIDL
jgi:hypothetical protein